MPDLVPSLAPAAPLAGVLPIAGGPSTARDGAPVTGDTAGGAFVDKLQAALAQLSGGTPLATQAPSGAPAPQPLQVPAPTSDVAPESEPAPEDDTGALTEELPELLAALGLLPLPPTLVPQTPVAQPVAGGSSTGPTESATATPALPVLDYYAYGLPPSASGAHIAPHHDPLDPRAPAVPATDAPASDLHASDGPASDEAAPVAAPASELAPTPEVAPTSTAPHLDTLLAERAVQPASMQPPASRARASDHKAAAPDAVNAAQPATLPTHVAHAASTADAGANQDNGSSRGDSHETRGPLELLDETGTDQPAQAANGPGSIAAATGVATTPQAERRDVTPSHVVAQIAHQAELYRLPGNRGVRVQLHPEDLGGLQVTVRYGAAGGLELHVNVEHAETGALVQSGWTELRDALALQGIAPERLIMNVTGGADSNPTNLADRGSGSNPAGFGQSQGGQQRRDQSSAQSSRPWLDGIDSSPRPVEDTRPVAGGNSRIDYRA